MNNKYQLIMVFVAILFICSVIYFLYSGWRECSDSGGVYLKAAFWYECVHVSMVK